MFCKDFKIEVRQKFQFSIMKHRQFRLITVLNSTIELKRMEITTLTRYDLSILFHRP